MGRTLIITEKPSVAREYAKVLGVNNTQQGYIENDDYVISWCVGHLVTMSYPEAYNERYAKWNLDDLPFLPETYKYEVIEKSKDQFYILKKFMNSPDISTIYYGGDSGREGEYIGRLVRLLAGVRSGIVEKRIWIDSFTEDEIKRGIREAKPLSDYDSLYDAASERAIEDYATGINFSRALSLCYGYKFNGLLHSDSWKTLTVGRVMTCVLGMIVAREREIRNFQVTDFYKIAATIDGQNEQSIKLDWKVDKQSSVLESPVLYNERGFKEESQAQAFIDSLNPALRIAKVDKTQEKKYAPLLFSLSELQNECTKKFKLSPDETLSVAQSLYEKKLTTYPRTDARVLSTAVAAEIGKTITGLKSLGNEVEGFCDKILASGSYKNIANTQYTDDSKITDHYAIIPTGEISSITGCSELEQKIYDLIVRRFLAIFYDPAVYTKVAVKAEDIHGCYVENFTTSARALDVPGYLEIAGIEEDEQGDKRQKVEAMAALTRDSEPRASFKIEQGETQPPKRYTSGSMILAMENAGNLIEEEELRRQIKGAGVGTSATRAEIISKLVRIGYIQLNKKTQILTPDNAGEIVYDIVGECLPELLSPKTTASWEKGLEMIRDKKLTKEQYEKTINDYVIKGINVIKEKQNSIAALNFTAEPVCACPVCGKNIMAGRKSYYCEGYKDSTCDVGVQKEICKAGITEADVKTLMSGGRIKKKMTNKEGKKWEQELQFNKETHKTDFVQAETVETNYKCPTCGKNLIDEGGKLGCECGYSFWKTIAGKKLSAKEIDTLFTKRKTEKLKGFKSKAGKSFEAAVILTDDGKTQFVFN